MNGLPPGFIHTVRETFGHARADTWFKNLQSIISDCERHWNFKAGHPFPNLSYNYAAPAMCSDGSETVLKIGIPNPELRTEIAALRLCNGEGMARLLEADDERGILLLERLHPGTTLVEVAEEDDEKATSIAAGVMRQLWHDLPQQHSFPSTSDWAAGLKKLRARFQGGTGPLPARLVEQAENLFTELTASMSKAVLLHGDLHHENILSAGGGTWLAIDPKGVVGEPEYECGALMRNPIPRLLHWSHPERITQRRLNQLADELGFDRKRLWGWGLAQAVLSAWWELEDKGAGWEYSIGVAEVFARIKV